MTKNLHNIVVFIKDEAMLQEAREILERYGQDIGSQFYLSSPRVNYLWFCDELNDWNLSLKTDTEITLPELEQLLKQNRDGIIQS